MVLVASKCSINLEFSDYVYTAISIIITGCKVKMQLSSCLLKGPFTSRFSSDKNCANNYMNKDSLLLSKASRFYKNETFSFLKMPRIRVTRLCYVWKLLSTKIPAKAALVIDDSRTSKNCCGLFLGNFRENWANF